MPIIKDYLCYTCGWALESWHTERKPHIPPLCPSCGKQAKHVYRPFGIVLKGLGWSRDGYSNDIDDAEEIWRKEGKPV